MRTRILFLLVSLLPVSISLMAQNTYQQLLPAGNDVTTSSGIQVTWSLGDVFADDVTGTQAIILSKVEENLALTYGLRLIGNPTRAITRLELTTLIPITYQVYNLQGQALQSKDAGQANRYDIDLGQLPPQVYLLSVFTTEGKRLMATYRIQKL